MPVVGQLYKVWHQIARVTHVGVSGPTSNLPDCIVYDAVGCCELDFRTWDFDFTRPNCNHQADKHYFEPWDGNGVFFGTPKSAQLKALLDAGRQLADETATAIRNHHDTKALFAAENRNEADTKALIRTSAGEPTHANTPTES